MEKKKRKRKNKPNYNATHALEILNENLYHFQVKKIILHIINVNRF